MTCVTLVNPATTNGSFVSVTSSNIWRFSGLNEWLCNRLEYVAVHEIFDKDNIVPVVGELEVFICLKYDGT